jgi:hypothetical protein
MSSDFGRALRVMAGPAQRMEARHYRILRGGNMSEAHEQGRIVKQLHDNIDRGAGLGLQDKQMLHTLLDNPENKTNQGLIRGRLRAQNTSLHNLYAAQINDPSNPGFEPTLAAATLQAAQSGVQIHPVNFMLGGASLMEMQQIKYDKSGASALAKSFRSKKVLQKARHFNSKQLLWYDQAARMSGGKPMAISVGTPSTSGPSSMQVDPQQNANHVLGGRGGRGVGGRGRGRRGGPGFGAPGGFDGGDGGDHGGGRGGRGTGQVDTRAQYLPLPDGSDFVPLRARRGTGSKQGYHAPPPYEPRVLNDSTIPYNVSAESSKQEYLVPKHRTRRVLNDSTIPFNVSTESSNEPETDSPNSMRNAIALSLGRPAPHPMPTIGQPSRRNDSGQSRPITLSAFDSGVTDSEPRISINRDGNVPLPQEQIERLRGLQRRLFDSNDTTQQPLATSTPMTARNDSLGQYKGVPQVHPYGPNDDVTPRIAFLPSVEGDEKEPASDPKVLFKNVRDALDIVPDSESKLRPNDRVPPLQPQATQNTTLEDATSVGRATPANNTLADSTSESPERPSMRFEDFASPIHNTEAGKLHLERFKKGLEEYNKDGKFNAAFENHMRERHRDIMQGIATEVQAQRLQDKRDRLTAGAPAEGIVKEPSPVDKIISQVRGNLGLKTGEPISELMAMRRPVAVSGDGASAAVKSISSTGVPQTQPAAGSKGLLAASNVVGRGDSLDHATDGVADSANNISDSLAGSSHADDIIQRATSLHNSFGSFSSGSSEVSKVYAAGSPRTPRAPLRGGRIDDLSDFFNSPRSSPSIDINGWDQELDDYVENLIAHSQIDHYMVNEEFERSSSDGTYSPTVSEAGEAEHKYHNFTRLYGKYLSGDYEKSTVHHEAVAGIFEAGFSPERYEDLKTLDESFERAQANVKIMTVVTPGDPLEEQTAAHPANDNQQDILEPDYEPNYSLDTLQAQDILAARVSKARRKHEKNRTDIQQIVGHLMATRDLVDGDHRTIDTSLAYENANRYLLHSDKEISRRLLRSVNAEDRVSHNPDVALAISTSSEQPHVSKTRFGAFYEAKNNPDHFSNPYLHRKANYGHQEHLLSKYNEAANDYEAANKDFLHTHQRILEGDTKEFLNHIKQSDTLNHLGLRASLYEQGVDKNRRFFHQSAQTLSDFGYSAHYEDREPDKLLRKQFPQVHRDLAAHVAAQRALSDAAQQAAEAAPPATSVVAPAPPQHETFSVLKQHGSAVQTLLQPLKSPLKAYMKNLEEKLAAAKVERDRAKAESNAMQQSADAFTSKLQQSSPARQDLATPSRTATNATFSTPVGLVASPAGEVSEFRKKVQKNDEHLAQLRKNREEFINQVRNDEDLQKSVFEGQRKKVMREGYKDVLGYK